MSNIGSFKKSGNEFQGAIVTMSVQTKGVRIVPEAKRLTFGTIAVATGVVGDALAAAVVALLDMATQGRRATRLDRGHSSPLRGGERCAVLSPVVIAVATEHVRHFGGVARHRHERQAGAASTLALSRGDGGKLSSGLTVAHTVLVARRRYRAVVLRLRCPSSN